MRRGRRACEEVGLVVLEEEREAQVAPHVAHERKHAARPHLGLHEHQRVALQLDAHLVPLAVGLVGMQARAVSRAVENLPSRGNQKLSEAIRSYQKLSEAI